MATYYRDKRLPNRFLKCRLDKNLTQEQLAYYLGLKRRAILNYEKANTYPKMETLIEMHRYLDVSLDYLLVLDPYKNHIEYTKNVLGLTEYFLQLLESIQNEKIYRKINDYIHLQYGDQLWKEKSVVIA